MTGRDGDMSKAPAERGAPALRVFRAILLLAALYGFLLSIALMEAGFRMFGTRLSEALMSATTNPFAALMIGLLSTSVVQSSSCTTSMIVGMVASGTLSVTHAVPMVMGANIGTTVTNTLVSLGHLTRRGEFRKAFAAATVHDFFNLLTVAILLPIEIATHWLERTAGVLSRHLAGVTPGAALGSPLKPLFKPVVEGVSAVLSVLPPTAAGAVLLGAAFLLLFACLYAMMRLAKRVAAGKIEAAIDRTIGRSPVLGLLIGLIMTAIVQSSSVVTSMLVPLAAAGVLQLEQVFAITLGANMGTTVTAILAALATGPAGLTIALVHLLFNVAGTAIFFPVPAMRRVPIALARGLADLAARSRWYAFLYVGGVFFLLPGALLVLWKLLGTRL